MSPQTVKRWQSTVAPATGYAFDAKLWNTIVAPNNNLDYLHYVETNTDVFLQLSFTGDIAPATSTLINWSTAVSPVASMWNASAPSIIKLIPNSTTTGQFPMIWIIECLIVYANAGTAGTQKQITFNTASWDSFTTIDRYEEATASSHLFAFSGISVPSTAVFEPQFTVTIYQAATVAPTNLGVTVNLFVRPIASAALNYFEGYI